MPAADPGSDAAPPREHRADSFRHRSRKLHSLLRWLHIYSSLLGFMTVLFFSVTGLTLNHPLWFESGFEQPRELSGTIPTELPGLDGSESDNLPVVEFLRAQHQITAGLRDIHRDDYQITAAFAGPGYVCDVRIDRETRQYQLTELRMGLISVINDLHKGRDTGPVWSVAIDISAILLILISLTGLALLCWLRRRWRSGLITITAGTALLAIAVWLALP